MECKICGSTDSTVVYYGPIKTGLLDGHTEKSYPVYQCGECRVIWNEAYKDEKSDFYESSEYRKRIDGVSYPQAEAYYKKYDGQVLDKLSMTGTSCFRNKIVADIGCAGGSFLDFVSGAAAEVIAVEPSRAYRKHLKEKGYHTYPYAEEAFGGWEGRADVVTSFDVIEHVSSPQKFADDIGRLCAESGRIIIGTPTDYPVLRKMLGERFDRFIFQVQHPWVFSAESLQMIFERAGFSDIRIVPKQKYGLGNLLAWLHEGKPRGDIKYDFIPEAADAAYKAELGKNYGEYLIVYGKKLCGDCPRPRRQADRSHKAELRRRDAALRGRYETGNN